MINIIYTNQENGPGKVVQNLMAGLNLSNIDFTINQPLKDHNQNLALQWNDILNDEYDEKTLIIGPNICVIPVENKFVMNKKYKKILVPSLWVKNLYLRWIPDELIKIWPVGINQNKFAPSNNPNHAFDCLIYFKRRPEIDLAKAVKILKKHNQTFEVIRYGEYTEYEFLDKLYSCKYVFVIDNTESQGIALQEVMSCNKPIFCWDVEKWVDYGIEHSIEATSLPYWNNTIGTKTHIESELDEKFSYFLNNLFTFNPRKFILENLNLEKQAIELYNFFKND